jgi:DNA polymerase
MGPAKFQATCEKYGIECSEALAERSVHGYRSTFGNVQRFWYDLELGCKKAINGYPTQVGKVVCYVEGDFLRIKLPVGRTLAYHKPRVQDDKITFLAADPVTKRYVPETIWGGTLVENVTQAVARDLMAESMFHIASSGFRILFTVHDELVVEAPRGKKTEADVLQIVRTVPSWAIGCPINAECEKTTRYKK